VVRAGLVLGGVVVIALLAVYALDWWTAGRFIQRTDDAYLRADLVAVAPKVQGYVDQIYVKDNQPVVPGQPLVKINADSYQASLAQEVGAADAERAGLQVAKDQIARQSQAAARAKAELAGARSALAYAAGEAERYRTLAAEGVETQEKAAQMQNALRQAAATAEADAASVKQAERDIDALSAQQAQSEARLAGAAARVDAAKLTVSQTLMRAGIAGRVGDKTVQIGQYVQAGTRLMSVVPLEGLYLTANFKETQLARMAVGQPAVVRLDALGGRTLKAFVESFSPGTGATFALLPPQNATGNFTKVVQRVPVRLRLVVPDDLKDRLLSGLSATVSVDTRPGAERRS
jgi:membrane fusion protein (multidrug efflux system)